MYPLLEVRGLVNRFGAQVVHDGLDMQVERLSYQFAVMPEIRRVRSHCNHRCQRGSISSSSPYPGAKMDRPERSNARKRRRHHAFPRASLLR